MKVAVLDVGKSNIKVVIVDLDAGEEIAARTTPNGVVRDGPYPHFDVDAMFAFMLDALAELAKAPGFDAISVTTHGASAAVLDEGGLVLPVLDYEHAYPREIEAAYDAIRPPFAETLSPRLPAGLNLGAQLHYQSIMFAEEFQRATCIVTYPQYWAWRLTGTAATDPTSLGCHTDLWLPRDGCFSSLPGRLGIEGRMAPLHLPADTLGVVTDFVADRLRLDREVPVVCGIHDSNASLLPHLATRPSPFSVVSTGTWVVVFSIGGSSVPLDPGRDTLANVDAYGRPVASARYMGGREFELLTGRQGAARPDVIQRIVERNIMILPSLVKGSGPFPQSDHEITNADRPLDANETYVAASLYVALMTATCLELTGAAGPVVLEGPFAHNPLIVEALSAILGRPVVASGGSTGTSIGAALLAGPLFQKRPDSSDCRAVHLLPEGFRDYAALWRECTNL